MHGTNNNTDADARLFPDIDILIPTFLYVR